MFFQCQDTLVQYGTFLASSLTIEEYNSRLPSINNLLSKYYIHSDVAFFLARPMLTQAIHVSSTIFYSATKILILLTM